MMQYQNVPATQVSSQSQASTAKASKGSVASLSDFGSFLNLFVTQLKYQDPLSPASQEEFLAQTAQFSSVEQLVSLNTKLGEFLGAGRSSAASLIGRKVEGTVLDEEGVETKVSGIVSGIEYGSKGEITLGLQNGLSLPLANVTSIAQA